jgi:hypothetical protein
MPKLSAEAIREHINFLRDCKITHDEWADYFEKYPDVEKEYCETGNWENASRHRILSRKYVELILFLEVLRGYNYVTNNGCQHQKG